jgi:hypothetical protein
VARPTIVGSVTFDGHSFFPSVPKGSGFRVRACASRNIFCDWDLFDRARRPVLGGVTMMNAVQQTTTTAVAVLRVDLFYYCTMLSSRLRVVARNTAARRGYWFTTNEAQKRAYAELFAAAKVVFRPTYLLGVACGAMALVVGEEMYKSNNNKTAATNCEAAKLPASGDIISTGTPVKEPATGILFPQLCNGYYLAGTGVRIKYAFVKVYAVGTYLDPLAVSAVKLASRETVEQALLDPTYPRTIRIVMNRPLSIDKYTAAIIEALTPRMKGQDLETLEEFKQLNPPVDLVQGMLFVSLCFSALHTVLGRYVVYVCIASLNG